MTKVCRKWLKKASVLIFDPQGETCYNRGYIVPIDTSFMTNPRYARETLANADLLNEQLEELESEGELPGVMEGIRKARNHMKKSLNK